jgi:acyl-CoA thioester hydrolase
LAAKWLISPRINQTHISELRVRYAETDQMAVVYHANYLVWCEVGRTDYMRERGASYELLERTGGVRLVVTEALVRYHGSARYDDVIRVETTLAELKSRSIVFDYTIVNARTGERIVTARTTLMSLDATGRVTSIPESVRAQLAQAEG